MPPPVTQKSVMLATQPGLVCITRRYPSVGVMSRMTFMNWPFQNSVNDWWPMTMRPSVVAEPVAMNAEQWLLRLPFGASLTYWLATVGHQYPVISIYAFQPMMSSKVVGTPAAVSPAA